MKLLVSDYDQTLYTDDLSLNLNIYGIKQFQSAGNKFMLSTGRTYESIKSEIKKHNIPYDYLSCVDGTIIYDKDGNILKNYKIDHEDYKKINYLKSKYDKKINLVDVNTNGDKLKEEVMITIKKINYKKMVEEIITYLDNYLFYSSYMIIKNNIFIKQQNINKSSAIKTVADKLDLDKSQIFTVGDSHNDVEMIRDYNGFTMYWGSKAAKMYAIKRYLCLYSLISDIESEKIDFVKQLRFK